MSINFACIWITHWFPPPHTSLSHTSLIPTRWGNRCKCNRKEHAVVHCVGKPAVWQRYRCALVVKKDINFNYDHSFQRWVWLYENAADVRHYQYARYYNITPSIMGNAVLYIARISFCWLLCNALSLVIFLPISRHAFEKIIYIMCLAYLHLSILCGISHEFLRSFRMIIS